MDKKKLISIITMVVGLITLVVGVVFLVLHFVKSPTIADGDYLVSKPAWILQSDECHNDDSQEECEGGDVVWKFTEIGKGTLTTNNHTNDYDFAWAIKENRLIIQTDWLYELDNEFQYNLDQGAQTLTLTDGEKEYRFIAQNE